MAKKKYVAPKAVAPKVVAQETFPTPIALGIKAFAITGTFMFIVQLLRGAGLSEGPDKAIYAFAILIAGIFLLIGFSQTTKVNGKYLYGGLAAICTGVGIAGIEQHAPINGVILSNKLWLGFGPYVLLLAIGISLFIIKIIHWESLNIFWKFLFSIIIIANSVLVVPSIWQDSSSIIEPNHSEYILNEMISQSEGYWPYSDFIPQYQSFYGFLLQPFTGGMDAARISEVSLILLSVLSLLALVLGVFIAWIAIDRRSIFLAMGLVIPFTALTQFPTREGYLGSISTLLSGLPIRILPGLVLIAIAILLIRRSANMTMKVKTLWYIGFGYISAITAWQSQDFGVAAVVACYLVMAFAGSNKFIDIKYIGISLLGFVPGFATYPIIAAIAGKAVNMDYFLFFSRQFGSGFGSERMRTPGPVLVILPLIVLLLVIHGTYIYKSKKNASISEAYSLNSLIGFSFALWSLFGFTYYLNRSYASGQMQVLFLPLAISVAALFGILLKDPVKSFVFGDYQKGFLLSVKSIKSKNFPWVFPLLLIISLPFATLILTPNPTIELKRLTQTDSELGWPKPTITASVADAKAAAKYASENNLSIAFFGASSNYVQRESGVKSASIFNSPFDLTIGLKAAQTACNFIYSINPDVIVAGDEGAALFQFEGKTLCNVYIQQDIPGVRSGHFAVKVSK
jgi:hypothetical protein